MELLAIGMLVVCFLFAVVTLHAVVSVSRTPAYFLQLRTMNAQPAGMVEAFEIPSNAMLNVLSYYADVRDRALVAQPA